MSGLKLYLVWRERAGGRLPSELHRSGYFFGTYKNNPFFPKLLQSAGIHTMGVQAHMYFKAAGFEQGFDDWKIVPGITFDPNTDNDITSPQSAPNLFQFADTRDMRRTCEVGRVHRAHGGAEDQICADAGMHQLMQHADLDGSQTSTARKDKGRPLGGMGHARSSLNLSSVRWELNRNSSLGRCQSRGHAATAVLVRTCRTSRGSARSGMRAKAQFDRPWPRARWAR